MENIKTINHEEIMKNTALSVLNNHNIHHGGVDARYSATPEETRVYLRGVSDKLHEEWPGRANYIGRAEALKSLIRKEEAYIRELRDTPKQYSDITPDEAEILINHARYTRFSKRKWMTILYNLRRAQKGF